MIFRKALFGVLVAAVLLACPPTPPLNPGPDADAEVPDPGPRPVPDASAPFVLPDAGSAVQQACFVMREVGCPEGLDPKCAQVLQHALDARISAKLDAMSVACIGKASLNKESVRACGGVPCK